MFYTKNCVFANLLVLSKKWLDFWDYVRVVGHSLSVIAFSCDLANPKCLVIEWANHIFLRVIDLFALVSGLSVRMWFKQK